MALDEVDRAHRLLVAVVLDGDGLHQAQSLRLQQAAEGGEIGVEVLRPDRFDHLD